MIQVYQIYFDDSQKKHFFKDAIPLKNEQLNNLFENQVILDLFRQEQIKGDYFGALSWKLRPKNKIPQDNLSSIVVGDFDILTFNYVRHDVFGYAEKCHPGFRLIIGELLRHLGLNPKIRPVVGLYQNAIIAKKELYFDFLENYLEPSVSYLKNCPERIQKILHSNSGYDPVNIRVAQKTFGTSYYPYHTFVLERLWSVYFHVNRKKNTMKYFKDFSMSMYSGSRKVESLTGVNLLNLKN